MNAGANLTPQPEQKTGSFEATILFCDIRGFTALFDGREPAEALLFANAVLGALGRVVESCEGTIDKFTGDGFLAHFGISSAEANHAEQACWCAIKMRSALTAINSARYNIIQPVVSTGIGIHSGRVAAGTISTPRKSEYTVVGSTVNLAARIESLTKFFSVDCLISDATENLLNGKFLLQKMPNKPLRGFAKEIGTSWLLPMNLDTTTNKDHIQFKPEA